MLFFKTSDDTLFCKENIAFFLMGMLVFSSVGSIILMKYLHLPLSLNEVFLIPFVFVIKDKFKSLSFNDGLIRIVLLTAFLLSIAFISGYFSTHAILSNTRAWFYLFVGYILFKNKNNITTNNLMYLSFGIIAGWAMVALYNIFYVMPNMTYMESNSTAAEAEGVMIGIPMFFSLVCSKKHNKLLLIGTTLMLFICLFGGQRRIIVVFFVSLVLSLFLSVLNSKKQIGVYIFISLVIISVFISLLPLIENFIRDLNPMLHHRIFVRTQALLEGGVGASNDNIRANNISLFFDNFIDYTVPRGFVSLQTMTDKGTGIFNDLPIVELCWIFSWPVAFGIVIFYISILRRNFSNYIVFSNTESMMSVICLVIMFLLLFLEGTYLNYSESSIITGAMLGRAVRNTNMHYILQNENTNI